MTIAPNIDTPAGTNPKRIDGDVKDGWYDDIREALAKMGPLDAVHCILLAEHRIRNTASVADWRDFLDSFNTGTEIPTWCTLELEDDGLPEPEHSVGSGCWGISSGQVALEGRSYCLECEFHVSAAKTLNDLIIGQNWPAAKELLEKEGDNATCTVLEALQMEDRTAGDQDWSEFKSYLAKAQTVDQKQPGEITVHNSRCPLHRRT